MRSSKEKRTQSILGRPVRQSQSACGPSLPKTKPIGPTAIFPVEPNRPRVESPRRTQFSVGPRSVEANRESSLPLWSSTFEAASQPSEGEHASTCQPVPDDIQVRKDRPNTQSGRSSRFFEKTEPRRSVRMANRTPALLLAPIRIPIPRADAHTDLAMQSRVIRTLNYPEREKKGSISGVKGGEIRRKLIETEG